MCCKYLCKCVENFDVILVLICNFCNWEILKELRFFVIAVAKKFRPMVEWGYSCFKHKPVLFFNAKITIPSWWIEGCSSCYYIPCYLVWDASIVQFPDFITCMLCISLFPARNILAIPLLEAHCTACVSFGFICIKSWGQILECIYFTHFPID